MLINGLELSAAFFEVVFRVEDIRADAWKDMSISKYVPPEHRAEKFLNVIFQFFGKL